MTMVGRSLWCVLAVWAFAGAMAQEERPLADNEVAESGTPTVPGEREPSDLRISAIAGSEDDYYVGIVDQSSGETGLIRVGQRFVGYEVTHIDPDAQEVHLSRDESAYILFLEGDETYMAAVPDEWDEGDSYDPTIESPEGYRSRDEFLRENAERLGMIEPGDPLPREWTEPVTREEALQRMAESVGMEVPADALEPRTREDFLREHGLLEEDE